MRPTPSICWSLALLLALAPMAAADEREPGGARAPPKEQAPWQLPAEAKAAAFLAAFRADDAARQAELAKDLMPDPWAMAEVLCNQGEHAAAAALAQAAPEKGAAGLAAYVETRTKEAPERTEALQRAWQALRVARRALLNRDIRALVAHAGELPAPEGSVAGASARFLKASALRFAGRMPESVAAGDEGIAIAKAIGWIGGEIQLHLAQGHTLVFAGDTKQALRSLKQAERIAAKSGHARLHASAIANQGNVYYTRSQYARALKRYERSIELKEALGDTIGVARTLANIGGIYKAMGKFTEALAATERAIVAFGKLGDKRSLAMVLGNLGNIYGDVGQLDRSIGYLDESLQMSKKLGDTRGVAMMHLNLAVTWQESASLRADDAKRAEDHRHAARHLRQAAGQAAALNDARLDLRVRMAQASLAQTTGAGDDAAAAADALIEASTKLGDRFVRQRALRMKASALRDAGDLEGSAKASETAAAEARQTRMDADLAMALGELAHTRFAQEKYEAALRHVVEATTAAETAFDQLGENEAVTARGRFSGVYALGVSAAAKLGNVGESLRLMEQGRAGAMLQSLGGRSELRWAMQRIPEEMRDAEQAALQAEQAARRAYEHAVRRRLPLSTRRKHSEALANALRQLDAVRGRMQREAMRDAGLFYPKPASALEIQESLEDGQAIVVYAKAGDDGHAIVLTPDEARLVNLGSWDVIARGLEAARIQGAEDDPTAGVAALRKAIVAPLALGEDVTEVILAPAVGLAYAPWPLLLERPVALAPSATTHALLREEDFEPGEGVLALGDPDYAGQASETRTLYVRGRTLTPLPGSRTEAKAVGTTVLLGAAATPVALREALGARERWRAAHFACHGLLDPENPRLCALALSAPKEGNGFLTALDVLGMDMPADLAVLSACETGRGTVAAGEGMRGLVRAFMQAGAPRVIASLWKVDDEATRALMVTFYELWSPKEGKGLPPAEALRKAQEHVRAQPQWKHPYYWAAWVLWGLPR